MQRVRDGFKARQDRLREERKADAEARRRVSSVSRFSGVNND
jgi:hypothetical protein